LHHGVESPICAFVHQTDRDGLHTQRINGRNYKIARFVWLGSVDDLIVLLNEVRSNGRVGQKWILNFLGDSFQKVSAVLCNLIASANDSSESKDKHRAPEKGHRKCNQRFSEWCFCALQLVRIE
jgi:hypothetical protein